MKSEIVIVGIGLTSKLAALALANDKCNITIIGNDNNKIESSNLSTFLSSSSLNFLKEIGIYNLPNESHSISEISCSKLDQYKINNKFQINFDNKKNKDRMGSIIMNNDLNIIFDLNIKNNKNIKIINQSVTKNIIFNNTKNKLIINDNIEISANLILISDKKSELIKTLFKENNFIKKDLNQTSLVMNVNTHTNKKAYQFFTKNGALAFLPVNNKQASIIWSLNNKASELKLDKEELAKIINDVFQNLFDNINILTVQKYKLTLLFAKKIKLGSVLLFGDAAHSLHPIAGQGLNLSIKDTKTLLTKIKKYRYLGYKVGCDQMLDEYEKARSFDNTIYTFGTRYIDQILKSKNFLIDNISNLGITFIENNQFIKKNIVRSATGNE